MKNTIVIVGIAGLIWAGAATSLSAQATTQDPAQTTPSARTRPPRHRRSLEERLKRLDTNNDGHISRDEWPRNGKAFDRLDVNHDGVLTQDELQRHARNRKRRR